MAQVSNVGDLVVEELLAAEPVEGPTDCRFSLEQRKDPELKKLCDYLEMIVLPEEDKEARRVVAQAVHFAVVDDILYFLDSKMAIKNELPHSLT